MLHEKTPLEGIPVNKLPMQELKLPPDRRGDGLGRQIATGYILIGVMCLVTFGWAARAQINGAVVGGGRVIVESNEKLVQHPTGGVVGAINVAEGAHVRQGDVVIRLDDTTVRANREIVLSQLSSFKSRLARLKAERDGLDKIVFPPEMLTNPTGADRDAMRSETRFFESRRSARENQKEQLRRRVDQLNEQIKGLDVVIEARKRQLKLATDQLPAALDLKSKNLVTTSALAELQQSVARLEGEYGSFIQQKATAMAQITETDLQIAGVDQTFDADVMKDLRETEERIEEYQARQLAAEDQLIRSDIRAPVSGIVHELAVHTVRGVVNPGETIMKIVPEGAKLQFEVRISPTDIDQITVGQSARLVFPAFNRAQTPEIQGKVTVVAADASVERQTGHSYYEILVEPSGDFHETLKKAGVELVPGMPVETFMQTGNRSVLSYLLKPFTDQIERAFREE
jgi:HlyD family secretion protein